MKLLLTSAGITTKKLQTALRNLTNKPFKDQKIVLIPTAANIEPGDKTWQVCDIVNFHKLGFKQFDMVDISAVPQEVWLPRLEEADIIAVEGGNSHHLMYWMEKSGLALKLSQLLQTRTYVGISAGSMICGPKIAFSHDEKLQYNQSDKGLGLVKFLIVPHLDSNWFSDNREDILAKKAKNYAEPVYCLNDKSAVVVNGDHISVVSTGKFCLFNP